MNAAILLMASAVTAGQPPAAPAPAAPAPAAAAPAAAAPAVIHGSGGCAGGDCGPVACGCDVASYKKPGLLDKIKARCGGRKSKCGCEEAPACNTCAPAPAPVPVAAPCHDCHAAPACNDCAAPRQSILDRLKAKFGKKKGGCTDCAPACDGCGGAAVAHPVVAPVVPTGPAPTPTPTPSPMPPRPTPGATTPKAEIVVPGVVTPVSGPRLTGTTSPY